MLLRGYSQNGRSNLSSFLCSRRYIDNTTFFQELYKATLVGEHRFVPGGSALAMARRFAMEGCETLLGATLTKKLENIVKENLDNFKGEGWFVAADKYEEVEQFQLISPWYKWMPFRRWYFQMHFF